MKPSRVELDRIDSEVAVLKLVGEHDLNTAQSIGEGLDQAQGAGLSVVIDVSEAEFVDSAVIAAIVSGYKRAVEANIGFAVNTGPNPGEGISRILDITGLASKLEVFGDRSQAIKAARDGLA